MRKQPNRVWIILFVGVALLTIASLARLNSGKDRIPWREDFTAATKESALVHKPIFLYLTASWCEPCQALKTSTWADADVARSLAAYVPVKIDIDAHPDLAAKYGSDSIPSFVILDTAGKPQKNSGGYLNSEEFLEWLKKPI